MKRKITFALVWVAASLLMAPQGHAQCPTGVTNPLTMLAGTWTFSMRGYAPVAPPSRFTSAGQFVAFIGVLPNANPAVPVGRLTITQSSSDGARQETDAGTYQVSDDCSGGTLTFNLSIRPMRFDFWFDEDFGEIRFVSTTSGVAVVGSAEKQAAPPVPTGSCQPSSSLSVLVTGTNVIAYLPRGNWGGGSTGVKVVNIEGTSIVNTLIPTASVVNSCASNSVTGETVCTGNDNKVYLLRGTALDPSVGPNPLASGGIGTILFSGGVCTNCGVMMDAVHNLAVIALSTGTPNVGGFQFLDLSTTPAPTLGAVFASKAPTGFDANISEDALIDPIRNLLLSPSEQNNYELLNVAARTSPTFFELATGPGGSLDSAGEDCSTGIALAPREFSSPTIVFIADLSRAAFVAGSPGTWTAPSQNQTLSESVLAAGGSGVAVAQGTHTGFISGEFGGNSITAIALPTTPGTPPAITDWVTCSIPGFVAGNDPHTVTAFQSPNSGDAIALLTNVGATLLAVVDLTKMLALTPRTVGGHACPSPGALPPSVFNVFALP